MKGKCKTRVVKTFDVDSASLSDMVVGTVAAVEGSKMSEDVESLVSAPVDGDAAVPAEVVNEEVAVGAVADVSVEVGCVVGDGGLELQQVSDEEPQEEPQEVVRRSPTSASPRRVGVRQLLEERTSEVSVSSEEGGVGVKAALAARTNTGSLSSVSRTLRSRLYGGDALQGKNRCSTKVIG